MAKVKLQDGTVIDIPDKEIPKQTVTTRKAKLQDGTIIDLPESELPAPPSSDGVSSGVAANQDRSGLVGAIRNFFDNATLNEIQTEPGPIFGSSIRMNPDGTPVIAGRNVRQLIPEAGQMIGGAVGGAASANPFTAALTGGVGSFTGGKLGNKLAIALGENEENLPTNEDLMTNAVIGEIFGLGTRGIAKAGSAIEDAIDVIKKRKPAEASGEGLIRTLSKWFQQPQSTITAPIEKYVETINPDGTTVSQILRDPDIKPIQVYQHMRENNLNPTLSQVSSRPSAAQAESQNAAAQRVYRRQDKKLRDIGAKLGGEKTNPVYNAAETRGQYYEDLTVSNLNKLQQTLSSEKNAIVNRIKSGPEVFYEVPKNGPVVERIINDPIPAPLTDRAAASIRNQIGELQHEGNFNNPALQKAYSTVNQYARELANRDDLLGRSFKKGGEIISLDRPASFDALDKTQSALGTIIKSMPDGPNKNGLLRLRNAIISDIDNAVESSGQGQAFKNWRNKWREYETFKVTQTGKTLGKKSGGGFKDAQRTKSPESGLEAPLKDARNIEQFRKLNGKEATEQFLSDSLLDSMYDPTSGTFNPSAGRQHILSNREAYSKHISSEQRHSLNKFIATLETINRRESVKRGAAAVYAREGGLAVDLSQTIGAGNKYSWSRGMEKATELFLDKTAISKLALNPGFVYSVARLSEIPKGTPAATIAKRNLLQQLGRLGATALVQNEPVTFDNDGNIETIDNEKIINN